MEWLHESLLQTDKFRVKQGISEDEAMSAAEMQMLSIDQSAMWDPFYD